MLIMGGRFEDGRTMARPHKKEDAMVTVWSRLRFIPLHVSISAGLADALIARPGVEAAEAADKNTN